MRVEQEHAAKLIHVLDVQPGDLIDTEGLWPALSLEAHAAEFELAEVDCIAGSGKWVDLIFINFGPSLQWSVDKPIVVQRRLNR